MENNNALVPSQEEITQLRNLTGESGFAQEGLKLPWLDFNGQAGFPTSGHFSIGTGEDKKDLGESVKGTIIRVRRFMQTGLNATMDLTTSEFDSYGGIISVYNRKNGFKLVDELTYSMVKEKYPELKLKNLVYIFSEAKKQVYKMGVSGGSLSNFWEYLKGFDNKDSVLRYITEFGSIKTKSDKGLEYHQMTFKKFGLTPNWKDIFEELKSLSPMISRGAEKKRELLLEQPEMTDTASAFSEEEKNVPVEEPVSGLSEPPVIEIPF